MTPFYCGLLVGLIIGACVGFVAAALMAMAGRDER
jgi:gas vesicle protein